MGCGGTYGAQARWGAVRGTIWPPWAPPWALTHVELPHKARHVAVLEVVRQHFLGKAALVAHQKTGPILQRT